MESEEDLDSPLSYFDYSWNEEKKKMSIVPIQCEVEGQFNFQFYFKSDLECFEDTDKEIEVTFNVVKNPLDLPCFQEKLDLVFDTTEDKLEVQLPEIG